MAAGLLPMAAVSSPAHAAADQVLILGSTVSGGASSLEAQEVSAQGFSPVVVDDSTWEGMTKAQFAAYRAIVIGDPTCGNYDDTSHLTAALSNPGTWGGAVNGNVLIIGTDPVYHSGGTLTSGPGKLIAHGIDFALAQSGKTGAYIDLSCAYGDVSPNTPVTLLDGLRSGGFTVDGTTSSVCYNDAHIVATHPALAGLTDADLSNWGCSVHESFDTWPADYTVLAMARNFGSTFTASDGTIGEPYILASGAGLHSFPLSLSPVSQQLTAGAAAHVTAQLLDSATAKPVAGQKISFRVEDGPDAGASGTCSSSCTTDANGQATWAFTGSKAANGSEDTIQAWIDTNGDGKPSSGEPQTTAVVNWTAPVCTKVLYVGARGSGEYGPGSENWPDKSPADDPKGFGPEVNNVYSGLATDLGSSNISAVSVKYGADHVQTLSHDIPKYFRDLGTGVSQTMSELTTQAALCPEQEIVLAGFSQGAMVMHRVLHQLAGAPADAPILSRVVAAVLIGDGDQVPYDNEVRDGSAWAWAEGVGQAYPKVSGSSSARFSGNLASRVIRVCNLDDIVCDTTNNTFFGIVISPVANIGGLVANVAAGIAVHLSYPNSKPLLQAIQQAASNAKTLRYYGNGITVKVKAGSAVAASAVVTGGKAPLTSFVGIDGTVPSWIALGVSGSNTVTLTGTAPSAGSWRFSINVQDASSHVVTISVSVTVTATR
jgi:hypothetical protein